MNKSNQNTLTLFLISLLGFIGCYLLNSYLAHHLSIYIYADYSIALKFLDLVVCIALFGTDVSSVCFLSKYLLNNQHGTLEEYIRWNVKLVSINILIARIIAWSSFIAILTLHILGIRLIETYSILVFVIWVTPFAAIFKLICSFLTGFDLYFSSMLMMNVFFYLVQFLFFAAMFNLFKIPLGYPIIALVLAGTYAVLIVFCAGLLDKNILKMISKGLQQFSLTPIFHPIWFPSAVKIISNSILFMLICSIDLFSVRLFSPNPKDTGCYAAILSIVSFLGLLPKNLYQNLKPLLSSHLMTPEGRQVIQKQINHTNKIVFLLLTIVSVLIIVFSKSLLGNFGDDYIRAQPALITMTLGLWYAGLSQFSATILIYGNLEGIALKACVLEIIIAISCTIPATYFFGINGTAITTAFAFIFNSLYCSFQVRKHLGLNNMVIPGYMPRAK